MYRFGSKTIQVSDDDQPKREVEQILGRKNQKNGLHYLVKWKGFQLEHVSWVPLPKLQKCIQLVKQYQRKLKPQNQLNIDMQFADKLDEQRPKRRKKKIFQQDLIFKKIPITSIKKQQIKQQISKNKIKKTKKQIKRQKKQNKTQSQNLIYNSFDLVQSGVNLCLQVSQFQSRAQNKLKQIYKNNQQLNSNQSQQNQQNDQEQYNSQSQNIQNESYEDQSLNLSQYYDQQDQKIALRNLNPYYKTQNIQKIKQKQKKLLRIQTPLKQLKLLDLKNVGKNSRISKIVNSEGIWLVQLKGQTNGYISVDLYKEISMSNLLEYLHNKS